ncbi:hypothetical protein A3Q56_04439 [Intoshia linei]|uniref:HTH psq-type domain-containing protein n=1 Tax=Intoshia linei TaxID=1819745 RepID=A0A177B0P1_9BILA|nr:hypothetical protein A3Q56_04439 [Intoshia linei]
MLKKIDIIKREMLEGKSYAVVAAELDMPRQTIVTITRQKQQIMRQSTKNDDG